MAPQVTYKYYRRLNSQTVYLVLHGRGSEGVENPFISNVINSLSTKEVSVFGFNFPYCERDEENSSGPELLEESEALEQVVQFLRSEGYGKITIVAKSLGGIITSYWLENNSQDVEVIILGYVIGSVKTKNLKDSLRLVIQGENDRFGNAEAVKKELSDHGIEAEVIEIPNADHSYRDEQKKPVYQNQAIELMLRDFKQGDK